MSIATFAAGCFWGVEEAFRLIEGVTETAVGYCGGHTDNPAYEDVCKNSTGHAEVVQVIFDLEMVNYQQLLRVFWSIHDPTQVNRQGSDVGAQYRSVVFYHDDDQKQAAEKSKAEKDALGKYDNPIATEIVPASTFFRAEDYHQQYIDKGGQAACRTLQP